MMIIRTDTTRRYVRVFFKGDIAMEFDNRDFTREFIEHVGTILGCEPHRIESVKRRVDRPKYRLTTSNGDLTVRIREGESKRVRINGCNFLISNNEYVRDYGYGYSSIVFRAGARLSLYIKIGNKFIDKDMADDIIKYFNISTKLNNKAGW